MRAYKKPGRPPCSIDECARSLYARGLCVLHYSRLRKSGAVGEAGRRRVVNGAGHVNPDGYRIIKSPDHPLARAQGKVAEHRAVLFDAIGEGPHACHWCSKFPLVWTHAQQGKRVQADHIDHDRLNNVAGNLVPACLDCNTRRHDWVAS